MKSTELTRDFVRQRTGPHRFHSVESLAKLIEAGMAVGVSKDSLPATLHAFMLKLNEAFPDDGWSWCPTCLYWKTPAETAVQPCRTCANSKP